MKRGEILEKLSSRRAFIGASLGAGLMIGLDADTKTDSRHSLQWQERALHGFGTTLWLRAAHPDLAALNRGLDEVVTSIREIETQMSLFDETSEIRRLNRTGALSNPGKHLVTALSLSKSVAKASNGVFDPTVQSFWPLWVNTKATGRIPTNVAIDQARSLVDWRGIAITENEIRFDRPSMQITLNGIAQGYAADYARDILRGHGIKNALINTGEWSVLGQAQPNKPWTLGVADPHHLNKVLASLVSDGDSIATSADNTTVFTSDRRFHHVLDPRTGMSPPHMSMVTVIAPSCALADALTKVFFMQEFDEAQETARLWGVKAILVDKAGTMKVVA
jgi:FAD:protein FMN transferase